MRNRVHLSGFKVKLVIVFGTVWIEYVYIHFGIIGNGEVVVAIDESEAYDIFVIGELTNKIEIMWINFDSSLVIFNDSDMVPTYVVRFHSSIGNFILAFLPHIVIEI